MTLSRDIDIDLLASKIAERLPVERRWLKATPASQYASMNIKRLKKLAEQGEIVGYPDERTTRKDWIFDKQSIDSYLLQPVQERNMRHKEILDRIERSL